MDDQLPMKPLQNSWAATQLEQELKDLLIKLYDDEMRAQADDINVYGAPFLGSFSLVERNVTQDGLTVLRQDDETAMRYLFKAWRFRNPQRGFHFLRTYLQCLFGSVYEVDQLWQKKTEPYPTFLLSKQEIGFAGESESDFYLTSRIRVDLDTTIVPDRIIRSLRTTIAARFLLDIRIAKRQQTTFGVANALGGTCVAKFKGETIAPRTILKTEPAFAGAGNAVMIFKATGTS